MTDRPRFLLDTEALLRAFRSDGPARELLQRGMLRDVSLVTSSTILDELDEVLARPRFAVPSNERETVREVVLRAADDVAIFDEAEAPRHVPRDPGDDHVVEAALRTRAGVVVTFDGAITELTDVPFRVLADGPACEALRREAPFGELRLLSPEEQARLRKELSRSLGGDETPRLGAYEHFRAATEHIQTEEQKDGILSAVLAPADGCGLITDLIASCGPGLLVDLRDGGSYDYVSGARYDLPGRGAPPSLDIIWYSSDRAATEAMAEPNGPTISDFGWTDEHRHRVVLAAVLLIVVPVRGANGEADIRGLMPVAEPLSTPPPIENDYRIAASGRFGEDLTVRSLDPAGFNSTTWTWLAGGPCSLLTQTALERQGLHRVFLSADAAAQGSGLPIPRPEVLEELLPSRFHPLIVRPSQ